MFRIEYATIRRQGSDVSLSTQHTAPARMSPLMARKIAESLSAFAADIESLPASQSQLDPHQLKDSQYAEH